jgi:predicted O-methyltransferase YrrM
MNNFTIADIQALVTESLLEKPTGNDWLDNIYNEQVGIIGHTNPYYRLFYLIAQALEPKFVVELGSWRAIAASHFAVGCPDCDVVTVDIHREDLVAQQLCIDAMNRLPNLTYINAWSWDAVETIKAIDKKIDVIFIDAWHDYQYAKREWDLYSPLLADTALVIADDITAAYNFDGMLQFWDELPGEKFLNNDIHPGVPLGFVKFEREPVTAPKRKGRPPRK